MNAEQMDTIIRGFRGCDKYCNMTVLVTESIAYDIPNPFNDEIRNATLGAHEDTGCLSFLAENGKTIVFIPLDKIASIELNLFEE